MRNLSDSELNLICGGWAFADMTYDGHTFSNIGMRPGGGSVTVDGVPMSFQLTDGGILSGGTLTWNYAGDSFSAAVMPTGEGMLNFQIGGLYIILCKRTIGRKLSPCPEPQ